MTEDWMMADVPRADTVALLEEIAIVGARDVVTGRVRVETHVQKVDQIARAELQSDVIDVTRVSIGRAVTGDLPQIRIEGDLTIIPVFEEIMVVEKRLVLKEEIHVRKQHRTDTFESVVCLRHEEAKIQRIDTPDR